ncbi:hypothetical protein RIF29_06235 [Crotalaria pallida]|uniref:Uncharacterized protein n=1 Tax=Crotalaria pallida TaxID=3830 RepID=A0AAN9J334_CROPI
MHDHHHGFLHLKFTHHHQTITERNPPPPFSSPIKAITTTMHLSSIQIHCCTKFGPINPSSPLGPSHSSIRAPLHSATPTLIVVSSCHCGLLHFGSLVWMWLGFSLIVFLVLHPGIRPTGPTNPVRGGPGVKTYYMDVMLVPSGLLINLAYHVWLWHKVRTQAFSTIFGIDADGRCLWVPAMMKDIDKKNIVAVQSIRNMIMGSTLMASTSILLCCGLGAVISSTYSVKKPISDSIFGAQGEFTVALKFATLFTIFLFSFLFHSLSVRFLSQLSILICTPQDAMCMVTPEYLSDLLAKATILNIVGNRVFYTGLPFLLWIFGPVMAFLCSIAMLLVLHELDFVARIPKKENIIKVGLDEESGAT